MVNPPKTGAVSKCGCRYTKKYRHYRTGKMMIATEYGYKSWCFFKCRKHR